MPHRKYLKGTGRFGPKGSSRPSASSSAAVLRTARQVAKYGQYLPGIAGRVSKAFHYGAAAYDKYSQWKSTKAAKNAKTPPPRYKAATSRIRFPRRPVKAKVGHDPVKDKEIIKRMKIRKIDYGVTNNNGGDVVMQDGSVARLVKVGNGTFKGRLMTKIKMKRPSFKETLTNGIVRRTEYGGNVTDSECVYICAGLAYYRYVQNIGFSLVKTLFKSIGVNVPMLEANPSNRGVLRLIFTQSPVTGPPAYPGSHHRTDSVDFHWSELTQFPTIMQFLLTEIFGNNPVTYSRHLKYIELHLKDYTAVDLTAARTQLVRSFDAAQFQIKITTTVSLTVQNVTLSNSTDASGLSADKHDVAANPVKGVLYLSPKRQNGFINEFISGVTELDEVTGLPFHSDTYFYPDGTSGMYTVGYGSLYADGATPRNAASFMKPPIANEFGRNIKLGKIHLNPGEVKKLKMVTKESWGLDFMAEMTRPWYAATSADRPRDPFPAGQAMMVAFEKSVDARRGGDADVSIDWETNSTYASSVYLKKRIYTTRVDNFVEASRTVQANTPPADDISDH